MNYLLCIGPKNISIGKKAIYNIFSLKNTQTVNLITSKNNFEYFKDIHDERLKVYNEDSLINGLTLASVENYLFRIAGLTNRAGWYFQQFLKMAFSFISDSNEYIICDADTLILNEINFTNSEDKNIFYYNKFLEHKPYIELFNNLFDHQYKTINNYSFIVEKMLIDCVMMKELISEIEDKKSDTNKPFWEIIIDNISIDHIKHSGFSEFFTYSNFYYNKMPEKFIKKKARHFRLGRRYFGIEPSHKQLNWAKKSFDSISFESWDEENKLLFWLSNLVVIRLISFGLFSKIVNLITRTFSFIVKVVKFVLRLPKKVSSRL